MALSQTIPFQFGSIYDMKFLSMLFQLNEQHPSFGFGEPFRNGFWNAAFDRHAVCTDMRWRHCHRMENYTYLKFSTALHQIFGTFLRWCFARFIGFCPGCFQWFPQHWFNFILIFIMQWLDLETNTNEKCWNLRWTTMHANAIESLYGATNGIKFAAISNHRQQLHTTILMINK